VDEASGSDNFILTATVPRGTAPQLGPRYLHADETDTLDKILLYGIMVNICTTCLNIKENCILPTQCICVFRMILTINSDYFPNQHYPVGLCSGDVMRFL
jgi:hypothetical protein